MILKRFALAGTGRHDSMADYIYLLQNRLTPAQWRALETVREAARAHAMPVFLVGGAVRDLTTGSPVRDLDFAVQGDVAIFIPELEAAGATVTGRNAALSSLYLSFRGGVRGELGSSLTVSYPKPGQPEAHPAPILDDLRRRDFTGNAMAVSLNEGSYGLLLDPLNGIADIENRELRLVSAYGFVEQPALLLRAARLSERLGWNLEERTANRYQTGKEENYIQALSATDRGYELEEIFHEEDPLAILEHMEAEGWRDVLFPELGSTDGDRPGLDHVRDLIGQLEAQGIHPDPSAVYFPLITAKLHEKAKTALKGLFVRQGFAQQIDTIEARAKELGAQVTSRAASLPSESWRLLMNADPELVLWLAVHVRTGAVQAKIKAFLKDWPQMRQKIPYPLMQELRITPDLPEYERLVDDLFFALMDGKLDTPEATRAFLEPYSPPAPPQIAVRRRPAKSARGRKRASEEVLAEPAEDLDVPETADVEDTEEDDADVPSDIEAGADAATGVEDDEAEPAPTEASAPKGKPQVAKAVASQAGGTSKRTAAKTSAELEPKISTEVKLPGKTATPVKRAQIKTQPSSVPPKAPHKPKPAKASPPARTKVRSKLAAKVAGKSASKIAAKTAGSKPATGKSVAKKGIAKPAKKTAVKVPSKKSVPVKSAKGAQKKVSAKKQAPSKAVAAKRTVPGKTAKKSVKGRGSR